MNKKYEHIDISNEKLLRIINASFEVFAKNDLEKASTNSIVNKAEVSRGLLYHYFKDKEDLFNFLAYFSIKIMVDDIGDKMDWKDTDFINRVRQGILLKCELMNVYPYMIEFLEKYSYRVTRGMLKNQVEELSPGLMEKWYSYNLDFSNVKEGIDIEKMKMTIKATLSEIVREQWNFRKIHGAKLDIDKISEEFDSYTRFFRKQFYK